MNLATIEVITGYRDTAPSASVIWLHGLGTNGSDFEIMVPDLALTQPDDPAIRFIFPHASFRPITCNNGYQMRAWYDIYSLDRNCREIDLQGIQASCEIIKAFVAQEVARGISLNRIFIAGFSQGGAIAYTVASNNAHRIGGLIALGSYIPDFSLMTETTLSPGSLPVFASHGTEDDVVPVELGFSAQQYAAKLGCHVTWKTYPIRHFVEDFVMRDVGIWLRAQLQPTRD